MKQVILLLLLILNSVLVYAQYNDDDPNYKTKKEILKEIEDKTKGTWQLDDNGYITYSRIVEAPGLSKDEIFNRVSLYFTYNYGSGKSVIQNQDREVGLIAGKGYFNNIPVGISNLAAWHILRVDVKEGKARIILSLTEYGSNDLVTTTTKISNEYPFNKSGYDKVNMAKAYYKIHKKAIASLDAVEKAIKEGSTSKSIEGKDW